MTEKVLLIGGGGREHAIAWKLAQSERVSTVFVAPGNAGTKKARGKIQNVENLKVSDFNAIQNWCKSNGIHLVAIGPEAPLADGIVDHLESAGIKCFGPNKTGAQIETSKAFSKDFMRRNGIPTAAYRTFTDPNSAKRYILDSPAKRQVVKASGLAAGKGVVVADSKAEAIEAVDSLTQDLGGAASTLVVEDVLEGEEISCLAFVDGKNFSIMPLSQDHKRAFEGDQGPNTGGMGAYAPVPQVTTDGVDAIRRDVIHRTVSSLKKEGIKYVGVLYAGMMMTENGPMVLEFNCRFGDPETESILPLLKSDLYEVMLACAEGTLSSIVPQWHQSTYAVGTVVVSDGYPGSYAKGKVITGIEECEKRGLTVFHAGTALDKNGNLVTSGGRVLVVVSLQKKLEQAVAQSQEGAALIKFEGAVFRKDIAYRGVNFMKQALTYKDAGVDVIAADNLVGDYKTLADATLRPGAGAIGGYGGVFDLKAAGYESPLLVSGTDGVGTKLELAIAYGIHDTVGVDLVAMCVNDILTQAAEPLFFLDYYAAGKLDPNQVMQVMKGVSRGCRESNCALVGGETAELPGMYGGGKYDLAGFAVGAVDRHHLLPRLDLIREGDAIIGVPSDGIHSNGFSLVRRIIHRSGLTPTDPAPFDKSQLFGKAILTPTRLYVKQLLPVLRSGLVKGAAHITGGGLLVKNIIRLLPDGLGCLLDASKWDIHPVFSWLQEVGNVEDEEMMKTFNCGLGMVLVCEPSNVDSVLNMIRTNGEPKASVVGKVATWNKEEPYRVKVQNFSKSIAKSTAKSFTGKTKVGVLISGSGTNLQALIDHTKDPAKKSSSEIALVISNVASAQGLERAHKAGIPTKVISHKDYKSREDYDMAVHNVLLDSGIQVVCLAGYMRILSDQFVKKWNGKLINVHPSLLPSFKGMHAHKQALEAGVKFTGCTVHFVDTGVDTGKIILQHPVPVLLGDTEEILQERVKTFEHKIYPQAMELLANGTVYLEQSTGNVCWAKDSQHQ